MELIRSFCGQLRALAVTLDRETARLQRALDGEGSDTEDYPVKILHDLCSEVQTLKDDVNILLDKSRLESQESISFMKAAKLLMKKNSADIMKMTEYFQKYGYTLRARKTSVDECDVDDLKPESAELEGSQKSNMKAGLSDLAVSNSSVPEKSPRSPQLSDFGLERYMISHVLPNPPQTTNIQKEEPEAPTPSSDNSLATVPKTPKCALKMDDFECVTPKLEHFGISEYTLCLNEDYTVGLKSMKENQSEEFLETEPMRNELSSASPYPVVQRLRKVDAEYTHSPLAPTFCTPGLKIPSTKDSMSLASTGCSLSEANCSSGDLEMKDCAALVFSSDECFEDFTAPSSPKISSYENLLQTPPPPDVTTIPADVLQILSKYSSNVATPAAVRAVPRSQKRLAKYDQHDTWGIGDKENW